MSYHPDMNKFEYKAIVYMEGALGSLILGNSKVDPIKFTEFLNRNGSQGWEVVTMEREMRRLFLLWQREAFVVIMKRTLPPGSVPATSTEIL